MTDNKATVAPYIDGFSTSDHEQVLSCLTDDVEWDIPGMFHAVGKAAFNREIENDAFVRSPTVTITRLIEEHDVVVAEGAVNAERKGGEALNAASCDLFVMRDAKIRRLTSYPVELE